MDMPAAQEVGEITEDDLEILAELFAERLDAVAADLDDEIAEMRAFNADLRVRLDGVDALLAEIDRALVRLARE